MAKRERRSKERERDEREELVERVVNLARTAKVVQGGRRFAFRAVVVVGDQKGRVGVGVGKARKVPDAIRKASDQARKSMVHIPLLGTTIPHAVEANFGAGKVLLKPASPGTGVIGHQPDDRTMRKAVVLRHVWPHVGRQFGFTLPAHQRLHAEEGAEARSADCDLFHIGNCFCIVGKGRAAH